METPWTPYLPCPGSDPGVQHCDSGINTRSQMQLLKTRLCGGGRRPVLARPHTQQTAGPSLAATLPASFVVAETHPLPSGVLPAALDGAPHKQTGSTVEWMISRLIIRLPHPCARSNSLLRLEARLSLTALDEFTDVMVKSRLGGFSSEEDD